MKIKKILKKFYYEKVLGYRVMTVVLRHKISCEQEKYLQNHKNYQSKNTINSIDILEIGFGTGEHLIGLAEENRENDNIKILGVELYKPGVIKVLQKIDILKLNNLFVSADDARDILKKISKNSLEKIFILFSDPWTKKRQFERRLTNNVFLEKCLEKLKVGGEIIFATDWENYADEVENILQKLKSKNKINYTKLNGENLLKEKSFENVCNTNFAKRAKREGRKINVFKIRKTEIKNYFNY